MVRHLEHDHVAFTGVGTREPQRQLVRLARRIHEVNHTVAQRARQRRRQPALVGPRSRLDEKE